MNATPTQDVQVALRKDSMNTDSVVITSAARVNYETSVLLGYQVKAPPSGFMWVISGYNDMDSIFTSGNKRKVNLGAIVDGPTSGIGQVEGIALADAERVFISSEYFSRTFAGFTFTVPQSLYGLDISPWMPSYIALTNDITDLSALPVRDKIVIQWQYNEPGFDHFDVESSRDGKQFSTVGTATSEAGAHEFRFTDPAPLLSDRVFYRIKIIMDDGSSAYSRIISVNDHQQKHFSLSASPSPFQQELQLSIHSDKDRQVELNLLDLYGRKLLTRKWNCASGDNQYEWQNLSSLRKSVYYITAQSEDDLLVRKIMRD